ncbi:A24 family peptidase [Candidatus Nitrospira allomarina]|uniref:A24 family peptidase n=1 Tax=Candidatus Nitrospira allomarina TaxID=3020900 RepID=A0AA96JU56_9BACT|nr:A24 family peptidase [Candidatus Nitrospira allomarina]WNM59775.1 A24 family peptidase [Candidatus Nitrospira allomarina]
METFLPLFGLAIGLVVAAVTDVREGRIPNWLTGSLAVFGIGVNSMEYGWEGFLFSLGGLIMGLVCLIFFYLKGGMGAGDVKLLGAIGTILGPGQVVFAFAFAAMLGGLYSIALLSTQGGMRHAWDRMFLLLSTLKVIRTIPVSGAQTPTEPKLRYALVLGLGTVIAKTLFYYDVL